MWVLDPPRVKSLYDNQDGGASPTLPIAVRTDDDTRRNRALIVVPAPSPAIAHGGSDSLYDSESQSTRAGRTTTPEETERSLWCRRPRRRSRTVGPIAFTIPNRNPRRQDACATMVSAPQSNHQLGREQAGFSPPKKQTTNVTVRWNSKFITQNSQLGVAAAVAEATRRRLLRRPRPRSARMTPATRAA